MNRNGTKSSESDTETVKSDTENFLSGTNRKKSEQFSERELAELMGTNRDTFKRHRGSVRRR